MMYPTPYPFDTKIMRGTVRVRIGDCECCGGRKHKQTY